jgi:hypothetical protein
LDGFDFGDVSQCSRGMLFSRQSTDLLRVNDLAQVGDCGIDLGSQIPQVWALGQVEQCLFWRCHQSLAGVQACQASIESIGVTFDEHHFAADF